jgi:hypothetical protein
VLAELIASSQTLTSRSSVSVDGGVAAAPPKPHLGHGAGGAGSRSAHALGIDDNTAPITAECQSFLDNVIAKFDGVWAWNDRPKAGQSTHTPHEDLVSDQLQTRDPYRWREHLK